MLEEFDFFPLTTRNTLSNLFREASRVTNGFRKSFNYPMNMYLVYDKNDEEHAEAIGAKIEAALAGFCKSDIEITIPDDNTISIEAKQNTAKRIPIDTKEVACFTNISNKDSSVSFATVKPIDKNKTKVSFVNGLLTVDIRFKEPEKGYKLAIE